jgi:hypothetical protein
VISQDAVAVLVPVVTTVLGAIGISLQDRQVRRSADERRRVAMEDAIRRVTFATQWLQARQSLRDSPPDARRADEQLAAGWLSAASAIAQSAGQTTKTRSLVSRLFLLYGMTGLPAKLVRGAFYLPVAFVGWIALIALGEILGGVTYADQASWEVTGSVLGGVLAWTLRGWAVSLDERKKVASRRAELPDAAVG